MPPPTRSWSSTPSPSVTFSRTVSANRKVSWKTRATADRTASGSAVRRSTPPRRTTPASGSSSRGSNSHNVDFPEPVAPTRATTSPGPMRSDTSSSTGGSSPWAKVTPSSSRSSGPSGNAVRSAGSGVGSAGVVITRSSRSLVTTARGSSWRKNPITRIGKANNPNRAVACTTWPTSMRPNDTCQAPMTRSATIPRLGSASITGSNVARMRPTSSRATRSRSAAASSRSISASERPRVRTASDPSKLSWAIVDTSPTRSCTTPIGTSAREV